MKKVTFLIVSCLMALNMQAETLKGKWNFEAPEAPYGFQDGTVEFKSIDDKTVAMINFGHLSYEFDVKETGKDLYATKVPIMGDELQVTLDNTNGDMKTLVFVTSLNKEICVTLSKGNN